MHNQKDESDCVSTEHIDQDIEAGKNAADKVCQYVDWLLSTVNPNPPHEDVWIRPAVHPCQKHHEGILDFELDNDYADLLNMVQRHTNCSTNYCLRNKGNESELKCRFNFPHEHCAKTRLEFEEIHSKGDKVQYKARVVTERNDSRLNNNQQLQLQGWRANCDIQVVIDHYSCVEYLTKYAAKGEPRSPMLKKTFNYIVDSVHGNGDSHKAIKKVVMKTIGERDYAAQETMHHLLSLKLHRSSFNVIPVSLNGSRKICHNTSIENDGICTSNSLLDYYASREQYDSSPETPYAHNHVPDWLDKLEAIVQSQVEPDNELADQQATTREEWMILSDLHTPFDNSEQHLDSTHDWHQDRHQYTDQQIGEMPTWIKSKKEQVNTTYQEYEIVDVNSFSEMQQLAYNIVKS
ncbi:hypothetical protein OS493_035694 [Desmophyllum pertusum]|uniref:Uncharacterized protein n=1 Tax=Desmophyllum pertusum TaxID=174260 RepID=A0A9X0CI13_9CNID|nr:hypothetical protein OS493_035694 [Desmophyllum pertusum]